ncbi:GNAT family N-acetyltransferase [Deinococcus sp. KNUC1210]|uniref:GNAT family N-acetyltransferase n=1 Tax=Deinococcus sp. KNUC1210 TaxID=2917691 RepID=UPI001EF0778D|nr:GNAT family N-acetyltransferase [Deinococcus sp. KNUC1210]ULH16714.1 GNAT family N-acetyltransferase [Deinococcus sp. KNUC1210]
MTSQTDPVAALHFRSATLTEAAPLIQAAAHALSVRGETLWHPAEVTADALARQYPAGHVLLGELDGVPAVTCILIDHDPYFWPDAVPGEALYLHKLAVLPGMQGRGLAHAMLKAGAEEVGARGGRYLRLDTAYLRPRLRAVYETFGFVYVGEKQNERHHFALYEYAVKG